MFAALRTPEIEQLVSKAYRPDGPDSLRLIPAPQPCQRIGQGLEYHARVRVSAAFGEHELVRIALLFEDFRQPLIREYPVAVRRFVACGAVVQLAHVKPVPQRFALAVRNERRVILPRAERILRVGAAG